MPKDRTWEAGSGGLRPVTCDLCLVTVTSLNTLVKLDIR